MNVDVYANELPLGGIGLVARRSAIGRDQLAATGGFAAGRAEYIKRQDGYAIRVIADFLSDGRTEFSEQEIGEVRWYPYSPSNDELRFALKLLLHPQCRCKCYPIHLDHEPV